MTVKKIHRIGIMGGTFDPIHYGHLVTAEEARYQFKLEKVLFVPAARPPHKTGSRITDTSHRLEMTDLAVESNPYFEYSSVEANRPGPSYTIDTVLEIEKIFKADFICFITGADAVLEILNWRNVEHLLRMCNIIAATRPGYSLNDLDKKLASLQDTYLKSIQSLVVPALAISSTEIRRRVWEGRPIKYLLPDSVEEYIFQHKLYK